MSGLSIVVGIYPELQKNDPGNIEYYKDQFKRVNNALHHAHLPPHQEPEKAEDPWVFDMLGFKTLHYLRRVAAYLCLRDDLPPPGDDDCIVDPINEQWCMWATNQQPHNLVAQVLGDRVEAPIPYEHLIVHSDAGGFYVPQQFHRVVIADEKFGVTGEGLIGSTYSLRDDCARIANAINLPLDLDPDSDEVLEAGEKQGRISGTWQPYGRESYACLQLHRAASLSIETGCALVFR